jgi:hypothetical protein
LNMSGVYSLSLMIKEAIICHFHLYIYIKLVALCTKGNSNSLLLTMLKT